MKCLIFLIYILLYISEAFLFVSVFLFVNVWNVILKFVICSIRPDCSEISLLKASSLAFQVLLFFYFFFQETFISIFKLFISLTNCTLVYNIFTKWIVNFFDHNYYCSIMNTRRRIVFKNHIDSSCKSYKKLKWNI